MTRRSGLASNALSGLDTVIPTSPAPPSQAPPAPAANDTAERKEKIAGYVPAELADQVRDAVSALGSHHDDPRSLSEFLENAARHELERLQDDRNDGQPFPHRPRRKLPAGRRPD